MHNYYIFLLGSRMERVRIWSLFLYSLLNLIQIYFDNLIFNLLWMD